MRHESFTSDTDRLLAQIEPSLGPLASKEVVSERWEMCRTDTLPHPMDKMGLFRSMFLTKNSTKGHVLAAKWISPIDKQGDIVIDADGNEVKSKEFDISGFKSQETYQAMAEVFGMLQDDKKNRWEILPSTFPQVYIREFRRPFRD